MIPCYYQLWVYNCFLVWTLACLQITGLKRSCLSIPGVTKGVSHHTRFFFLLVLLICF